MLDGLRARQRWGGGEIARLNGAVLGQARGVQRVVARQFLAQIHFVQDGVGAQLDGEAVAQVHGGRGLGGPAHQFGTSGGQHAVVLLAGLACVGRHEAFDPAGTLHACQLTVNLLVRGVPEIADGFVEAPCQVVARGGFFQQGGQNGVRQRHGGAVYPGNPAMQSVA